MMPEFIWTIFWWICLGKGEGTCKMGILYVTQVWSLCPEILPVSCLLLPEISKPNWRTVHGLLKNMCAGV